MIGIMSAMQEEIAELFDEMLDAKVIQAGMRTYYQGTLWGKPTVLVFSRWGKVAAATTATFLIERFGVEQIIFCGVAGGADQAVTIGDVVIASNLYQHDMDARPLVGRHEIPLLGITAFPTDVVLRRDAIVAAESFIANEFPDRIAPKVREDFRIASPKVVEGEVASGDRFLAGRREREELKRALPGIICVEMEGAALAQVCYEYGVPFAVIRTISDAADECASFEFSRFVMEVARLYSHSILKNLWKTLAC
jgi:adenosylhomocysteine nucleosidase